MMKGSLPENFMKLILRGLQHLVKTLARKVSYKVKLSRREPFIISLSRKTSLPFSGWTKNKPLLIQYWPFFALSSFHFFLFSVKWSAHTLICLGATLVEVSLASAHVPSSSSSLALLLELEPLMCLTTIVLVVGGRSGRGEARTISSMSPHMSYDGPTMNWMKPEHKIP